MYLTPNSFTAFLTPSSADWLNDLSFNPPSSVERPTDTSDLGVSLPSLAVPLSSFPLPAQPTSRDAVIATVAIRATIFFIFILNPPEINK